jgi:hypothetical protein
LTDEHISKALVRALRERGWDVVRAVEVFGAETDDELLFEYAAENGRVLVTTDEDFEEIASRWLSQWRRFRGLIIWKQDRQREVGVGAFLREFDALAALSDDFGGYPVFHLKPRG